MEAPQAACNFCGKHLVMGEIYYTSDARVACAACNARVDLVVADMRVGHNIRNASISSVVAAGISLLINPFLILTIVSIVPAIWSLIAVNKKGDERFTQHIQRDKPAIYACSIIAIVIDGLMIILFILAMMAASAVKRQADYGGY